MKLKTISLDRMVELTQDAFNNYVEPVAYSFMSGEVPATTFMIHRTGTKENDWLAHVRFKNTVTISVFRCEVYIDDILNLCRKCRMYLVTEEVYRVTVLYVMLHPLYQTQHMNFKTNVNVDYDSMMAGAAKATYNFIVNHFDFHCTLERTVLEILRYHAMVLINNFNGVPKFINVSDHISSLKSEYEFFMNILYPREYKTAIKYKARTNLVDKDGFIKLEPKTQGGISYVGKEAAKWVQQNPTSHVRESDTKKIRRVKISNGPIGRGISDDAAIPRKLEPSSHDEPPVHSHDKP